MPSPEPTAPTYEVLRTAVKKLKKEDQQRLLSDLISPDLRELLARCHWSQEDRQKLGLFIEVPVYVQDPAVARANPELDPDKNKIKINWEPGLAEGPTSARLAVLDYDGDTKRLEPPVQWNEAQWCFVDLKGQPLTSAQIATSQFHQVNVWAIVQRVLDFYEDTNTLGRPVPWAFSGNRLIIVPHAGDGQNACYDPVSKSLQFYYFDDGNSRVYTCLSHDIVAHETGHAVLDGIRPYFLDGYALQTAAFHEFVADLTAILSALRNNDVRRVFADFLEHGQPGADFLANLADQFGQAVMNRPYLRTARNPYTMDDVQPENDAHFCSQVLTGMVFDILLGLLHSYRWERGRKPYPAAWDATQRITRLALQPLDYLPPVDVTFGDYARALLQRDYLLNPDDPYKYRSLIREVCNKRKIPVPQEDQPPEAPNDLPSPSVNDLLASRVAAYNYLHANRKLLRIPTQQDIVVVDVYAAKKVGRAHFHLPRDVIVQYLWGEDVALEGSKFGPLEGMVVPLLCGGTLVFDENRNFEYWVEKPGTEMQETKKKEQEEAYKEGNRRKQELLDYVAGCVAAGDTAVYDRLTTGRFTTRASLSASPLAQLLGLPASPRLAGP
jgi:hypothetical protein